MFINLFHINVSNQYKSAEEDSINHAWRPIPAGRISVRNATILRWALLPISLLASIPFGWDLALTNIGLLITIVIYDNFAGAHHWVVKNMLNVSGYALLEYGASRAMGK
jgi:4-hydroxybenzoate polyprenyltransferase